MTIFMYVLLMIDSAAWGDNLSKGSYIVIGHFDFLMKNIFFTSLIVGLVLIEVALIPGQIKVLADITSKKGEAILNIISSMEYKDTEYVEVTDGKQLGYVRAEALKTLY